MKSRLILLVSVLLAGCATKPACIVPTKPSTRPLASTEYAELRWEVGPSRRAVTFEQPGEQFHGVWFQDALDHLGLSRKQPSNTPKATSSDLLTALRTQGWHLDTHAIGQDRDDVHVEVWTLHRYVVPESSRP